MKTWVRLCCWRLRRKSTGYTTTGTAGTSLSRPHLETTRSSPVSAGWWMTKRWCCAMDEVSTYFPHQPFIFFLYTTTTISSWNYTCLCLVWCALHSTSTSGWQDQHHETAQTQRAGAEEEELQVGWSHTTTTVTTNNNMNNNYPASHRWREWQPGFPMSIDANRHKDLPRDIQFDTEKGVDFVLNYAKA